MMNYQEINRVGRKIFDTLCSCVAKNKLCFPAFVFTRDAETGNKYYAAVRVSVAEDGVQMIVELPQKMGRLSPMQVADGLLEDYGQMSIMCDPTTAKELATYSLSILVEGRQYRLLARPKGFLEVYTLPQ